MNEAELKILADLAKGMDAIFGNEGARKADDCSCPVCGKRGITICNCEGA